MLKKLKPQPFDPAQSDKCTFWLEGDWGQCCLVHDAAYHYGGTARERKLADQWLRDCIQRQGGAVHWLVSWVVYTGVRFGGHPAWPGPLLPVKHQPWNGHRPYKERLWGYYESLGS